MDLTLSGESVESAAGREIMLTRRFLAEAARLYGGGLDARDPRLSPLFGDLTGLPPMLIQAGTEELLLDDARRLAERAQAAGVPVTFEVGIDLWHDWQLFAGRMPEADAAIGSTAEFIRLHFAVPG